MVDEKNQIRGPQTPATDLELARASHCLDAPLDAQWFVEHPGETLRVRQPTMLEIAANNLPTSVKVLVFRLSDGTQGRVFVGRKLPS